MKNILFTLVQNIHFITGFQLEYLTEVGFKGYPLGYDRTEVKKQEILYRLSFRTDVESEK